MSTRMLNRWRWVLAGVSFALLSAPFWLSYVGLFVWSPLNCWRYDLDLHSGRLRYTRHFLFAQVAQRVEESTLSGELLPEDMVGGEPDWHPIGTFSPGVHYSGYTLFLGTRSQMGELELDWKAGGFTPAARRASARRVLQLWQQGKSGAAATPYLHSLNEVAFRDGPDPMITDLKDLPGIP